MKTEIPDFKSQNLILSNELWTIEIQSRCRYPSEEFQEKDKVNKTILLAGKSDWTGFIYIKAIANNNTEKNCLIDGIDGGFYLYSKNGEDPSQSVKLVGSTIYFSLGFTFFSFDLVSSEVTWQVRPDTAEVFEFYDLEYDFLLRGELEIHRITKNGEIKWSFSGQDIWVNMEGKREVQIEVNQIRLTDFNNDEYIIDYNGKLIKKIP